MKGRRTVMTMMMMMMMMMLIRMMVVVAMKMRVRIIATLDTVLPVHGQPGPSFRESSNFLFLFPLNH
jgi:hypothetical protein